MSFRRLGNRIPPLIAAGQINPNYKHSLLLLPRPTRLRTISR